MPVPFSNMKDIVYFHDDELAEEIFDYLLKKGYRVCLSDSLIKTGTHGDQEVKRLDVFKKKEKLEVIECEECEGSGFSKAGTGYDSVCDKCGCQGEHPKH